MTHQEIRSALAEFIGTFMLVLVGAGAVATFAGQYPTAVGADVVVAALAHGLILVAIVATFGHISGAHVNPAVTLGLFVGGKIDIRNAGFYWVAQFLGGLLAAAVLRIVLPEDPIGGVALAAGSSPLDGLGKTMPAAGVTGGMVMIIEGILTFFLVSTVYQAAVYGRGGSATPLLIGFTLAAAILFGGPLTGASLNPARTLGPAFLARETQDLTEVIFYLVSTMMGGLIAGFVHSDFFAPEETDTKRSKRRR